MPPNFRETMRDARIQGYRVLFFEREWDGRFRLPQTYERQAMACIATHDLPTLSGWWAGLDLDEQGSDRHRRRRGGHRPSRPTRVRSPAHDRRALR